MPINAQSLNSKYDELLLLLNIAQSQNIWFHVICVQETWLSEMSDYSLVDIDRKWQDYVYIQCEYKSTKQKIKHLLREENKVKENKIS